MMPKGHKLCPWAKPRAARANPPAQPLLVPPDMTLEATIALILGLRVGFNLLVRVVQYAVDNTPSVRDDARWHKFTHSFGYLAVAKLLDEIAGLQLPK